MSAEALKAVTEKGHTPTMGDRGEVRMVIFRDKDGNKTNGFLRVCVRERQYPTPERVREILTGGSIYSTDPDHKLVSESIDIQMEKQRKLKNQIPADMKNMGL